MNLHTEDYSFILGCDLLHVLFDQSIPMEFVSKSIKQPIVKKISAVQIDHQPSITTDISNDYPSDESTKPDGFGDVAPDVEADRVELSTEDHLANEYETQAFYHLC